MNTLREIRMCAIPDRILILVNPQDNVGTAALAQTVVEMAQDIMPKVTGGTASTLKPIHGDNYFGIYFPDKVAWFLEQGTSAFTMKSIAGKVIPMWIDDPTGIERRENPKAKVRRTEDGRVQVLIFRKVGVKNKGLKVSKDGKFKARYPGQAGRIGKREAGKPLTTAGRQGGRIAKGNVGVAWRNPGTVGRRFLNYSMTEIAAENDLGSEVVYLADGSSFDQIIRM